MKKRGISLIVLVITIIVIIILAVAVILSIANNNPIENAKKAAFQNDIATLKEELDLYIQKQYVDSQGTYKASDLNKSGEDIKEILPDIKDKYIGKIAINGGSLEYTDESNMQEYNWASETLTGENTNYDKAVSSDSKNIQIDNATAGKLENLRIYGNSIQNGTPTPDNPVEIQSVGDKTFNVFDNLNIKINHGSGITIEQTKNKIIIDNSKNQFANYISIPLVEGFLKPNTTYTSTVDVSYVREQTGGTSAGSMFLCWYLQDNTTFSYNKILAIGNINKTGKIVTTFTTPENFDTLKYLATRVDGYCKVTFENLQIQEGEVSTEFEPYGYRIPVKVSGFNLINEETMITGYIGTTGNRIESHSQGEKISDYIEIDNTKTYSIKQYTDYTNPYIMTALYDKDKNFISGTRKTIMNTFLLINNIDSNAKYIKIAARALEYDNNFIQLVEGKYTADTIPDKEPVTTNIYLNEPLRKIGDYTDYIDFKNKKIVRNIKESQINNSSLLNKFGGVKDYSAFFMIKNDLLDYGEEYKYNPPVRSNTFKFHPCGIANSNNSWTRNYQIGASVTANYKRMCFTLPNTITDIASAKEWLTENPIDYFYITSEPDDTETIELPNIPTNKGTNIITVDTTIQPSKIEVVYGKEK